MLILLRSLLDAALQHVSETVSTSTVETVSVSFDVSLADSISTSTTESSEAPGIFENVTDSIAVTTQETSTFITSAVDSSAAAISDSVSSVNTISTSRADSNSADAQEDSTFVTTASDSSTSATSDSTSSVKVAPVALSETSVASTSSEISSAIFSSQVSDSLVATETQSYPAVTTYDESVSDTNVTSTLETSGAIRVILYAETALGVSELPSSVATEVASSSDTISANDTSAVDWIARSTVADTATVTSLETAGVSSLSARADTNSVASSETTNIIAVASRLESNPVVAAESSTAIRIASSQDSVVTASVETPSNSIVRTVTDSNSAATSESSTNTVTQQSSDALTANESSTTAIVYPVSRTDTVTPVDSTSSTANFLAIATDSSLTSTIETTTQIFVVSMLESISAAETISAITISHIADSVGNSDSYAVITTYNDQSLESNSSVEAAIPYVTRLKRPTHERSLGSTISKSAPTTINVFLRSCIDHLTAVEGLGPVVKISKAGSAFVSVNRTVIDIGEGVYSVALTAEDTNTVGELLIMVSDPIQLADNSLIIANVSESASGGLTTVQSTMLLEMYELLGLDPTKPLIVTGNQRVAGDINQTIITSSTETIVTRV